MDVENGSEGGGKLICKAGMLTRPQPHEAEAKATTHEAEAITEAEAEAKTHLEILIIRKPPYIISHILR